MTNRRSFLAATILAPLAFLSSGLAQTAEQAALELPAPDAYALASEGKLTLIDIRRPEEWRQTGVAQGARRINMIQPGGAAGFLNLILEQTGGDHSKPIGLICRTGNRTTQVQAFLMSQGFTRVYNIREGMAGSAAGPGWLRRGLPVEDCSRC